MAQQVLNVGSNANDGTGDTLRNAMIKVNDNFTEIYASPLFNDAILISGNEIAATRTNDDLVFSPAGTGGIRFPALQISGNNIEGIRTNEDINLIPSGTGSVVFGSIQISGTSFSSGDSSSININDGLIVDGTANVSGATTLSGTVNLGSTLTATSGATSLSALTVTGTTTLGTTNIDNLNFDDNIISSDSNADIILTPGGTGSVIISNLTIDSNINITDNQISATASNSDLVLSPAGTGNVIAGSLKFSGTTISSDDSSSININEGVIIDGTANVSGATTLSSTLGVGTNLTVDGDLSVTGTVTLSGNTNIDNLNFNDNIISSDSNADIRIVPGGTGSVLISNLTIDSNINITDNEITTLASNSNLVLSASGTGSVVIDSADINGGTIDNTVIGGTTAVAGTFTTVTATTSAVIDGVTIQDNEIASNASNADLVITASGSGKVNISGFDMPSSDGSNGQVLRTDGAGTLSFATAGASLNFSDIADASTTVASSATSVLNTFAVATYRSAKYYISITDATNSRFEIVEANVTHDGTNAFIATFGSTTSYTDPLCTFTADINSGNVRILVTNITSDSTVFKFQRMVIDV